MRLSRTLPIRLIGAAAALTLVAAACSSDSASAPPSEAGTSQAQQASGPLAPASSFETFDGQSVTLTAFQGRPVVLNFWASWCPSCVAEISAAFRPVQEDLGGAITFLGMNIQDERTLALELLNETGVAWVNAEDSDGTLYSALGGLGMPFTVVISAEGVVLDSHNGPLDEGHLRSLITETLG